MTTTPNDIEREHKAALASLTKEQRKALARIDNARQRTWTHGGSVKDCLGFIFILEADKRNCAG